VSDHRRFCPNNRPNVAYPRRACTSCTAIDWSVSEALGEVVGDLTARMDREVAEKDGDGLLDGLRYAVECVIKLRQATP
jgi:hypothetical protein